MLWHYLNFRFFEVFQSQRTIKTGSYQKQRIAGPGEKTSKGLEAFMKEPSKNRKFVFIFKRGGGGGGIGFFQILF